MVKVVFFDRDGIVNEKMPDGEYVLRWEDFRFVEGIIDLIKTLKNNGYKTVIVTNQRAVHLGYMTESELDFIHRKMQKHLEHYNCSFDLVLYCPHAKDAACGCRKPSIGMLEEAEKLLMIDKNYSFLIGDSEIDIMAGKSYSIKTVFIGDNHSDADISFRNLISFNDYLQDLFSEGRHI